MLTHDEFEQAIKALLAPLSAEQLRALLQRWAEETHPRQRQAFIERLRHHCLEAHEPSSSTAGNRCTLPARLAEMQARLEAIAQAEPEWGAFDEEDGCGPFAPVMPDLFDLLDEAATCLYQADPQTARETYAVIWAMVEIENDYGHSPSLEEVDEAIAREHAARYLRAVYLTTAAEQRVDALLEAASRVCLAGSVSPIVVRCCTLREIAGVASAPLPGWEAFLGRLASERQTPRSLLEYQWLREALASHQGLEGIATLAKRAGAGMPRLWLDWVSGGIRQGDLSQASAAWQAAQSHFARGAGIWHEFAECFQEDERWLALPQAATIAFEALLAKPCAQWLQALQAACLEDGARQRRLREAAAWLATAAQQGGPPSAQGAAASLAGALEDGLARLDQWLVRPTSFAPWGPMAVLAWCLAGDLRQAEGLRPSRQDSLGWSLGDSPSWALFACLPTLLAERPVAEIGPAAQAMWRQLIVTSPGESGAIAEPLNQAMLMACRQTPLQPDEKQAWLHWCAETATERCHSIVSGQHRKAYARAATCVALCRETAQAMGQAASGDDLVQRIRQRYPRHTAFQRALDQALSGSDP